MKRLESMEVEYKKDKDASACLRIEEYRTSIHAGHPLELHERTKVEVDTLADVLAVGARKDFVRFCNGGHPDIHSLIAARKKEGRSDWYA